MTSALIIVAHGSSVNPESAEVVERHTQELAKRPRIASTFDEVRACFLKQAPNVDDLHWQWDEVTVVPFFMAEGYFVNRVLPKRLGIERFDELPTTRQRGEATVRVTHALGAAPQLDAVILAQIAELSADATVVLVGHGTERSDASSKTLEVQARRVLALGLEGIRQIDLRFVDQPPRLERTWDHLPPDRRDIVVIPYFAFPGPHVYEDIPQALGLPDATTGPHTIGDRRVFYGPPVGAHANVVDVLERLALTPG